MKSVVVRLSAIACLFVFTATSRAQVVISEFMASNQKTLADQDGEFSDWIELFNNSSSAVDLDGWSLTDNSTQLTKWRFPRVTLAPKTYLVVFASGKNRTAAAAQLHTNFSLDAKGEYLALIQPNGSTIASEFTPGYPEQFDDISYGLSQDLQTLHYFSSATPGRANTSGFLAFVADTQFSHKRGFYDTPFDLAISTVTANATIRYTTNGVAPTATTGLVYSHPIRVSGTTTLRAAAFKTGFQSANVDTQTYIFLDDVIRQSPTGQAPPGWPASWGGNVVDYGMDPDVVNNALYSGTIKSDLKSIPSFSIVMDVKDLFDPTRGIYANPGQDGRAWERPASVELINPDSKAGFQINAGLRIRGGFSRSTGNPKHAFRFFFRDEYGDAKLKYPLFGNDGADTFDAIDLRTFQNYSWSFQGDTRGVFLRDQFSRDTQLAMGHQAERGNFYHLYINGQYWGLYNTCERPEASFGATYFGGNKDDYDVIKVEAGPYTINATDGNMDAWTRLYNLAKAGLDSDAAYQRIQGNNPDGSRNPAYEVLLDVPNLIDYMLVIIYGGNLDAPISNFLGNTRPNNWYGIRNRTGNRGFRFFAHDSEHTLLNVNEDRTGPFSAGDSSVLYSSPQYIWKRLQANPEFRLRVADHVQRHFFNGGALTAEASVARFMARKAEIDRAVVGESARWGDAKRATPFTRNVEWVNALTNILRNFFPGRGNVVLNQLRVDGFWPTVAAPSFSQHGGNVTRGLHLSMSSTAGAIYYTVDGSDPRLLGGALSTGAQVYTGPLTLDESLQVKARVLTGPTWSPLNDASFTIIQTFKELLVTEIMYNPPNEAGVDGDELEFIELKNVANTELDLSGVRFTNGVAFTFSNGTRLGPGQFAVLVSNPVEFQKKYPGVPIAGSYTGRLSNGGETLTLVHAVGTPIVSLTYSDENPWPSSADGSGFSLVAVNPNLISDPNNPANWRASSKIGGSPGADDSPVSIPAVWVNEVLTHTDPPAKDAIELFNPNPSSANIGGWYLTDERAVPKKFRIPIGTTISAGGYRVFTEDDFNPKPGVFPSFTLSSHGQEVYLFSADAAGNLTGYSDGFSFGAAANGVTFGRYRLSTGAVEYPAQTANTLGSVNAGPRIGPVVINEINYHPASGDVEFVELKNVTSSPVKLFDPLNATNTWKLDGIGFDFPMNTEMVPNGLLVVVATDPAVFRSKYGVPSAVPVFGPFAGSLQDKGELLQLQRPDSPDVDTNGIVFVPYITVDAVRYDNHSPWPTNAAGLGGSLERLNANAYGNEPGNWRSIVGAPSPGIENTGNRPPLVNAGADLTVQATTLPFTTNLVGKVSDDSLPQPPGVLTTTWTQVSGPVPAVFGEPHQLNSSVSFLGVGTYVLRLIADDGALQNSADVSVTISRVPIQLSVVPAGSIWKYLDNGSDQGTAWRNSAFNDLSWASGKAQLGYGDSDEATILKFGPDSANKYVTTYFRRSFSVSNASSVTQLKVRLLRDDGAVVYLNGTEVFRSNMPAGDITYTTLASSNIAGADESTFYEKQIDPSLLVEGNNLLAVEIHQNNGASADISFDLELNGIFAPPNQRPTVSAGPDFTATPGVAVNLKGLVVDDGLPSPPGRLTIAWSKVSGPGSAQFANASSPTTTAVFSDSGTYVLQLTATDGEFSASDDIAVTVTDSGMAEWRARYFTSAELASPAISGDTADPDGDGHSNFQEFTAGTDPRDAKSVLKLAPANVSGAIAKLRFTAITGKTYSVQYRNSLVDGAWIKLRDVPAQSSNQVVEVNDSNPASGTRFYRVVTPQQP